MLPTCNLRSDVNSVTARTALFRKPQTDLACVTLLVAVCELNAAVLGIASGNLCNPLGVVYLQDPLLTAVRAHTGLSVVVEPRVHAGAVY